MKRLFVLLLMFFISFAGYSQTLEIYTDNGSEGFRLYTPQGQDTIYIQKATYLTDFVKYTNPPVKGIKIVNYFGGEVTRVYPPDSVTVDGSSYSTFLDLTAKLDSIFVNFNTGGVGQVKRSVLIQQVGFFRLVFLTGTR